MQLPPWQKVNLHISPFSSKLCSNNAKVAWMWTPILVLHLQHEFSWIISQKVITGYYAIPTNYTSIGVPVGRGARNPIESKPVMASPQSSNKDGRVSDISLSQTRLRSSLSSSSNQVSDISLSMTHYHYILRNITVKDCTKIAQYHWWTRSCEHGPIYYHTINPSITHTGHHLLDRRLSLHYIYTLQPSIWVLLKTFRCISITARPTIIIGVFFYAFSPLQHLQKLDWYISHCPFHLIFLAIPPVSSSSSPAPVLDPVSTEFH